MAGLVAIDVHHPRGAGHGALDGHVGRVSVLLGLPTLGAACVYEAIKSRHALATGIGLPSFVLGLVVSFFVAWAVIAGFIKYLQKNGLEPFGYYRILLGIVVVLVMRGA